MFSRSVGFRGFACFLTAGFFALPNGPSGRAAEQPWPAPVPRFVEPQAGEHPRLFLRQADVPELRRRAADTTEGRAIVARLRYLLGNDGERLPEHWNSRYPVNIGAKGNEELPIGAFTIAHPAGYGMLYQLTGDKKYADMARQCLERMFNPDLYRVTADLIRNQRGDRWQPLGERLAGVDDLARIVTTYGQPDRDERYTWTRPGAKLRIGPMMFCVALAYDLCYDGWDEPFRRRVVAEIVDYDHLPVDYDQYAEGHKGRATMDRIVHCEYPPTSNHFGAYIGGAGIALLAVRGDPGADAQRIDAWLATIERQAIRLLTEGFGDHGFFAEGHGPSHMAANTAFVPFLQAARTAWGRDFITPRSNAPWLTLRWAMEVVPGDKPWYPNYHPSSYGPEYVARGSMSEGGEWAQGFGALVDDRQRAAMLWTYRNAIERQRPLEAYDAWLYPHRAVLALVNWPIGIEPRDPGQVLGHVAVDETMGHYMFRKQWRDKNDLYFTFFLNPRGKHGYVKGPRGGNFAFYGYGIQSRWRWGPPQPPHPRRVVHFASQPDGSGVLSFEWGEEPRVTSIAVDWSETAGVGGVVLFANPWFTAEDRTKTVWNTLRPAQRPDGRAALTFADMELAGVPVFAMLMHEGAPPEPTVVGNALRIGRQIYRFDGQKIVIDKD